jgi:hypothetical protein
MAALATAATIDAANEACIFFGQIFTEDEGSHTIDTTGSSSLGWKSGALTFANAGTTVKVGLAALNTTTGPPVRAANVADVVTLDVSRSIVGGSGGITANTWQEHVPTAGSKTIANGDFVAFVVQMTARAGVDSVIVQSTTTPASSAPVLCGTTSIASGAYAAQARLPNAVITFSDGILGYFYGGQVAVTGVTVQSWNSGSATKEYGNFLQPPFPGKVYGILANCSVDGDTDFILYSDPLGTPVAQNTVSVDANAIGQASTNNWLPLLFSSPYTFTANQPLAVIIKPTTATTISSPYKTFQISGHQKTEPLGAGSYAVNRASGAFAAQNSNKDRFAIGLLVGAFDDGTSTGGGPVGHQCM